jgi:hypothetical protein
MLIALSVLSVAAVQVQGSPYDRVAYWDSNFGTAWAGDGIAVRDALVTAGYRVVTGTELKAWMDARIADKKLSVVVMCRDAVPNTVAEAQNATCTIRRYLEAGGKVVWYSDIPFYYVSAPGGTNTTWGDNGSINVLGFAGSSATRDVGAAVTITEAGTRWGLKTAWTSTRPTGATITPNLEILAVDRNGAASGWVKHYVPGDTFRGFVRIEDHTGAPVSIANLIAVAEYFEAFTTASEPVPASGATDVPRDVVLGWTGTEQAASHNVYFGTTAVQVENAVAGSASQISQGKADLTCDPDGLLEYGQTYYWRVDEVNAAPDYTAFKGEVWSFTVEPFAYPIKSVTATASGSSRADTMPANTVNGSGLNAADQHSVELTQMWMSDEASPQWIQYEFDQVYALDELWVWNANQIIESFVGFGAKSVTVEYSTDGAAWTTLDSAPEFARGSGMPTYMPNTIVDFGGVSAKFVKLTINSNWGGMAKQVSLSEVRFHYVPLQAREPVPANAATDVALTASMNWRPGRDTVSHKVFFGTDSQAVAAGTAPASTVTEHAYTPASMNFGTKYFWKVNEVGDAGTYEGNVWSFTSREFAALEDFEGYTDDEGARIYESWVDGLTDGTSGSTVGYMTAPFAEQAIVHAGKQSMPLAYDNSKSPYVSEAYREFETAQNVIGSGATELCVWTRGYPALATVAVAETGGKMSVTGAGADIWNNSDEFTYAYKTLSGDGAMVARVVSTGTGTNTWAKGGVMIRDSLNGGSTHAMMAITTPGVNGASFQYRANTNGASATSDSPVVVAVPAWVKIERVGSTFTGYTSADGKTWSQVGTTVITMADPVQIGIAVTSHVAGVNRTYQFESIAATGSVAGTWQGGVINAAQYNDPAAMYLTVTDSAGKSATATSATAANVANWTRWTMPMSSFPGVSFSKIKKLTIGVGTKGGSTAGGSGMVFIDDIGYGRSAQ